MNEAQDITKVAVDQVDLSEVHEVIDQAKCTKCGGKCCKIYLASLEGGCRPPGTWFEEWVEEWDNEFKNTGATALMPPLFYPLVAHLSGNQWMLNELKARGIDPDSCVYRGPNGCLLPRKNRPKVCREYMCKEPVTITMTRD